MPISNRLLIGPLGKYRGIEASTVASAMVNEACSLAPVVEHVVETWEYDDMIRLA